MSMITRALLLILTFFAITVARAAEPEDDRQDARSLQALIDAQYAYPDRLPGGAIPITSRLRAEAEAVGDRRSLLRYAERALLLLADHHAITQNSLADSWALVPSFADLWVVKRGAGYVVDAVRPGSPAARAAIRAGDTLATIGGVPTSEAVRAFWADLGAASTDAGAPFAARVLAAGRRDAPRRLGVARGSGPVRQVELVSLYALPKPERPPVSAARVGRDFVVTINDSLGDDATIAAFGTAMKGARPGERVVIDLTETPGGGDTTVARAIMGWFVDAPRAYQIHDLPRELRRTGIARRWVEQVLPRPGKRHRGPVVVRVGRWTGSMGEGLAIGFDALGARVEGGPMAGLLGAIYDHRLPRTGLVVKLPTERLFAVDGTPRETWTPRRR